MRNDRILVIRTGGTVDSEKYDLANIPPDVKTLKGADSLVESTIRKLPTSNQQNVDMYDWGSKEDRFVKDSKYFSEQDLEELADVIRNDDHKYFVITHGNDRIRSNALALNNLLEGSGKTVIFTGSMIPLSVDPEKSDVIELLRFTIDNITDPDQHAGVFIAAYDAHTKRARFFDPKTSDKDFFTSRDVEHQGKNQRLVFRDL